MGEFDDLKRREAAAYEVSPAEFYRDFRDVANLNGERPIVKQVDENTAEIAGLKWKLYTFIGAVGGGIGLTQLVKLVGR